jgi:iron complex transport system permease protein
MNKDRSYGSSWLLLIVGTLSFFLLDLSLGSVTIPISETVSILVGKGSEQEAWQQIILLFRLPRVLTALGVGAGLAVSGLLMQTLFRNPLAGPFVLGISSGASLGVALIVLAGSILPWMAVTGKITILFAAGIGSASILFVILLLSRNIADSATLLIIGLMFGSISGALVSVLQFYSHAESLQSYMVWTFGNLGNVRWADMPVFIGLILIGLSMAFVIHKSLNTLMLGEKQAIGLGVNIRRTRIIVLLATSVLAGGITAYCGPIAFIGLAVPHLTRVLFATSDHKVLIPAVALTGALIMIVCDFLAQMPGSSHVLPINAVTAILGGPVVIWVIVRKRNLGKSF